MHKLLTLAALISAGSAAAHVPGPEVALGARIAHVLTSGHHVPVIIVVLVVVAGILGIARRGALLRRR